MAHSLWVAEIFITLDQQLRRCTALQQPVVAQLCGTVYHINSSQVINRLKVGKERVVGTSQQMMDIPEVQESSQDISVHKRLDRKFSPDKRHCRPRYIQWTGLEGK